MKFVVENDLTDFDIEIAKLKVEALYLEIFKAIKKRDKQEGYNDTNIEIYTFDKGKHPAPFWTFKEEEHKHIIAIPREPFLNNKIKVNLCHSFFHEFSHAIHSVKSIKNEAERLKKEGVPFDYLNIFEDIRIERLIEKYLGKPIFKYAEDKYKEKYLDRMEIEPEDTPFQVLYKLLVFAGYHTSQAYRNIYFIDIKSFVEQAINAKNTSEVTEIAIEFFKKYKNLLPKQQKEIEKEKLKIKQNGYSVGWEAMRALVAALAAAMRRLKARGCPVSSAILARVLGVGCGALMSRKPSLSTPSQ
jgi:hypothetical protein